MSETVKDYMPETPDINQERLELLKQECPDWFTEEGQLDIEEIKKVVDDDTVKQSEQFEFTWFGKDKAKREAFTPTNLTLKHDKERSVNPEKADGNLIIEGENLEVLKLLLSSYRDKVKCIYIDPPYNTGKDFVYSDNYSEDKEAYWKKTGATKEGIKVDTNRETKGRFHSDWLSMMYSRLLVARQLLSDEGVIFLTIDDNEIHHLRKLCDEVFGEENFLGSICWKKKTNGNNMGNIPPVHDYILAYAKKFSEERIYGFELSEEYLKKTYKNPDNDPRGRWTTTDLSANHEGPYFAIKNPNTGKEYYPPDGRYWVFNEDEVKKRIEDGRIIFGKSGEAAPVQKKYLQDRDSFRKKAESWWDSHGLNEDGTKELAEILGTKIFDHPKPTEVIRNLIEISTKGDEEEIVLDFFAGSGTTAHSVLKQNIKDKSDRKFILVQLHEATKEGSNARKAGFKKISDITFERNRRVIEGYGDNQEPIDSGFKAYKLAKSNFPRVEFKPDPEKSQEENVETLKEYINEKESSMQTMFNEEDIIDEVLLKNGFMLNYSLKEQEQFDENNIYLAKDDHREALVCLDGELHEKTVEYFKGDDEQKFICLERALDTSKKWNLKNYLGDKLNAM